MKFKKTAATFMAGMMILSANGVYSFADDAKICEVSPVQTSVATTIFYNDGTSKKINGIPEDLTSDIASYEVTYNGKVILKVENHAKEELEPLAEEGKESTNGYYSVEFDLSASEGAFITGLTKNNVELVQDRLLTASFDGKPFDIVSLDFIDTDKTGQENEESGDNNMCWAASTSNILHYTGWGKKAGFSSEDDLFDLYAENFLNTGGFESEGLRWFFNGVYNVKDKKIVDTNTGNYLNEYAADTVMRKTEYSKDKKFMRKMAEHLKSGEGIDFSVAFYDENKISTGGHALTLWGYVYSKNPATESEYIKSILISDNNDYDNKAPSEERRRTRNRIELINIELLDSTKFPSSDEWGHKYFAYGFDALPLDFKGEVCVFKDFTGVKPYSDSIDKESDKNANLDSVNTPNLVAENVFISDGIFRESVENNVFDKSSKLSVEPIINNISYNSISGNIAYSVIIENDKNERVFEYNGNDDYSVLNKIKKIPLNKELEAGNYELTLLLNTDNSLKESYYSDNIFVSKFTITDTGVTPVLNVNKIAETEYDEEENNSVTIYELSFDEEGMKQIRDYYGEDARYDMYVKFIDNGKEDDWQMLTYEAPKMPLKAKIIGSGTSDIQFCVSVNAFDKPILNVMNEKQRFGEEGFTIIKDDSNSNTFSKLESGAAQLLNNEKFAFKLQNNSIYDTTIEGDVNLIAKKIGNESERINISKLGTITLSKGNEQTYSISEFDSNDLNGAYDVYVNVKYQNRVDELWLGTIYVKEKESIYVDIANDVTDEYDGFTSLREAVAVCGENDTIIIDDSISKIKLKDQININKKVKISGEYTGDVSELDLDVENVLLGKTIQGMDNQLFYVSEGGELTIENAILNKGLSKTYGGNIEANGGNVYLKNCAISNGASGISGGNIYIDNGILNMKNCFTNNGESGVGGAVGIGSNGIAQLNNCTISGNKSNGGSIYVNGGELLAVNSTIVENTSLITNDGSAVTATLNSKADLINCIALDSDNNKIALSGKINTFACATNEYVGDKVNTDENIVSTNIDNLYVTDDKNNIKWIYDENDLCISTVPRLTEEAKKGVFVKNINGKIAYELADGNTVYTDIAAVFEDDDYKYDCMGNERGYELGSYILTDKGTVYGDADDNGILTKNDIYCILDKVNFDKEMPIEKSRDNWFSCIDVDNDGQLTANDAAYILRKLENNSFVFPAEK